MSSGAVPFPVLPGKSESDVRRIAERFKADPTEYRDSRGHSGVTLERAYWQQTPMGDFVVAYLESDKPSLADAFAAASSDPTDLGHWFAENVKDVHGVDISSSEMPGLEIVGEWSDPEVMTRGKGMAFSAPLIPDRVDAGRAFGNQAFNVRREEFTASRRALGQNKEVVTLVHTPMGPVICVYLEGTDAFEANRKFAASSSEFDVWFKDQCRTIFPPQIDFNQPVPGITEIFDSLDM